MEAHFLKNEPEALIHLVIPRNLEKNEGVVKMGCDAHIGSTINLSIANSESCSVIASIRGPEGSFAGSGCGRMGMEAVRGGFGPQESYELSR